MLLSEERSSNLIDAGLDRISFSIEGTDPERFERERKGASFDKIVRNIDALMALRKKKGVDHPKVRIQTVALPYIDLDDYSRFWTARSDEVAAIDYKESEERRIDLKRELLSQF